MIYTDEQIDIGVAVMGDGYVTTWDEVNEPYWAEPVPPQILFQRLYVVNWASPVQSIFVQRYKSGELYQITRSGEYLEKAFAFLQDFTNDVTISSAPIFYDNESEPTETYIISANGIIVSETDLTVAKWKATGLWALTNITNILDPTYFKITRDSVLLADENTFFLI
jgi:hypothetical protein